MSSCGAAVTRYVCVMHALMLLAVFAATPALAETELHYAGYAAGSRLVTVTAVFDVAGPTYQVRTSFRMAGPAAALFPGGRIRLLRAGSWQGAPGPTGCLAVAYPVARRV